MMTTEKAMEALRDHYESMPWYVGVAMYLGTKSLILFVNRPDLCLPNEWMGCELNVTYSTHPLIPY